MNRVELRGGLTRDAEARQVGQAKTDLVTFTLAVNGTRYDSQERQQVVKTIFVSCQAWGPQAVECMSFKKGDEVYVVGELDQYRKTEENAPSTRVTVFQTSMLREGYGHRAQSDPWG